MMKKKKIVDIQ